MDPSGFESFALLFLAAVLLCFIVTFVYDYEVYAILPGWGPIRKFDSDGSEDLRINQLMIHRHIDQTRGTSQEQAATAKAPQMLEGSGCAAPPLASGQSCFSGGGVCAAAVHAPEVMTAPYNGGPCASRAPGITGPPDMQAESAPQDYGAIGSSSWGHCNVPWARPVKMLHPQYGPVTLRTAFCDTQFVRTNCGWWARDEPHYMQTHSCSGAPLKVNADDDELGRQQLV